MRIHSTGGRDAKAVGYLRVSTSEQATSGLGLEAQQAAIEATALKLGLPLDRTFVDAGVSGGLTLEQRPALLAALDALGRGDVLIIAKRDRLGRDVLNVCMIDRLVERRGARVVSSAGEGTDANDPTSRLMRQIVDAFAEYERAIIRARTKSALDAKRAKGERTGNLPFGFQLGTDGQMLEPHDGEQRVLARISELRAAGATLRSIADALNADGCRTRTGGAWQYQYVARRVQDGELAGAL
ncbi:MAG: recombinase family protein [Acidobacteriota bacterium]|nr:recombinase family protein [Acidobacteriota bacterium]MDQ3418253.1 recombinase family protein [Acidobacteriota bacterium]